VEADSSGSGSGSGSGSDGGTSATDTSGTTTTTTATDGTSDESSGGGETTTDETGPACGQAVGGCDRIDVLFVVDNSGSIEPELFKIIPLLDADAFESIAELACSYHIGVTTTEEAPDYQPVECQTLGALNRSGALNPDASCFGDFEHPPYLDESDDINRLGCLLAVGLSYDPNERQLRTMLNAVGPDLNAAGQCNDGFLRDDAALLVILVTDEDDDDDTGKPDEADDRTGSPGTPTEWWTELITIKEPQNMGVFALLADQPEGCEWTPLPDNGDGTGAEYGERILTWMQHFGGVGMADHVGSANVCLSQEELAPEIDRITELIGTVCADSGL
jgi:hypothetical protein